MGLLFPKFRSIARCATSPVARTPIYFFVGISKSSFYRVIWKTMYAIVRCENLQILWPNTKELAVQSAEGFSTISTNRVMTECVAVLDGYHMEIATPPKKEVQNVKSYFSGHYQTYSINIQAVCDHNCRFLFIGVGGPGVMGDREAIKESGLYDLVEKLPGLLYCIGDCAYTPTEHLTPIYGSDYAKKTRYDNYNFYASQLRIRIEMSFGLMVKKWGILSRPLTIKMQKVKLLICCIGCLHNYCIDERLLHSGSTGIYSPKNTALSPEEVLLRERAADYKGMELTVNCEAPYSNNRE